MCDIESGKINLWIQEVVGNKNFTIEFKGAVEKGKGFLGDVYFFTITPTEPTVNKKELDLAIKVGKTNQTLREKQSWLTKVYKTEVAVYQQIIPALMSFQEAKNIKDPFDSTIKCYKTIIDDSSEVIILDNMKEKGFVIHPKDVPLNLSHLRFVLKKFAKFHALSFAMQDQQKDTFEKLTNDFKEVHMKEATQSVKSIYDNSPERVLKYLKEAGRQDLIQQFQQMISEKSIHDRYMDILNDIPNEKVVIHGDCHTGNFLFKYKGNDLSSPSEMVMFDFQLSALFSPIVDISLCMYLTMSKDEFPYFEELIEFYYDELCACLIQLGSDPDRLFPRNVLKDHLKRYMSFGFLVITALLEIIYIDKGKKARVEGNKAGDIIQDFSDVVLKNKDKYIERLIATMENYFYVQNKF